MQDSVHLYDYTVKVLFLLHQHLPPDTLTGHTSRWDEKRIFLKLVDHRTLFSQVSGSVQKAIRFLQQVP